MALTGSSYFPGVTLHTSGLCRVSDMGVGLGCYQLGVEEREINVVSDRCIGGGTPSIPLKSDAKLVRHCKHLWKITTCL